MKTIEDLPSRKKCIAFAIISSSLSSIATLFKVQGLSYVPPLLAAVIGILFAGGIAWIYLILVGKIPKKSEIALVFNPLCKLVLCRPVFSNILFTFGLANTSAIKAIFLTKMEPYLVIFWCWALDGKRPAGSHLLLLMIHVIGALLLSVGGSSLPKEILWGDCIVFLAVVTAALSYRYVPQITKVLSPVQTSTLGESIGGVVTLPLALMLCPVELGPQQLIGWGYILNAI